MAWPSEYARVRIAQTPLKEFAGVEGEDFGEQHLWLIPLVHRALTDHSCRHRMPDLPASHAEQMVYWEGAFYLLTLAVGWTNPAKGLKWWYDAGKPVDEPVLRLLKDVWDHRGHLERLAAWLWLQDSEHLARRLRKVPGASNGFAWSDEQPGAGRGFVDALRARWSKDGTNALLPYSIGGNDMLHLGHFRSMFDEGRLNGEIAFNGGRSRSAAIVIDLPQNWYYQLCLLGERLPSLGEHSWLVDVIVKGWGWMGTYCRSRETGLWFIGTHSTHLQGN